MNASSRTFSKFIFILLKYHHTLEAYLPDDFFINIWSEFFYCLENDVISILTRVAVFEDYSEMMDILLANTVSHFFGIFFILKLLLHEK